MKPHHRTLFTIFAVAVLVLGVVSLARADHGRDSLIAHVRQGALDIDLSARSSSVGTDVRGQISATDVNSDPNREFSGEVLCLRIAQVGGQTVASYGGVLTRVPPGTVVQGFLGFASDAGKFSNTPDTFTFIFQAAPVAVCPAPVAGAVVVDGEVVIHNTFP